MAAMYIAIAVVALVIATLCFLILPFVCSYFCATTRGKDSKASGINNGSAPHRPKSAVSSDHSDCEDGEAFRMIIDTVDGEKAPPDEEKTPLDGELERVTVDSKVTCSASGGCNEGHGNDSGRDGDTGGSDGGAGDGGE